MMWRCATEYHQSGSFADPNSRLHKPELRSYACLIYEQQVILLLKGIPAEFQVIRGFSQKIPADLLSYDKIHS